MTEGCWIFSIPHSSCLQQQPPPSLSSKCATSRNCFFRLPSFIHVHPFVRLSFSLQHNVSLSIFHSVQITSFSALFLILDAKDTEEVISLAFILNTQSHVTLNTNRTRVQALSMSLVSRICPILFTDSPLECPFLVSSASLCLFLFLLAPLSQLEAWHGLVGWVYCWLADTMSGGGIGSGT